MSTHNPVMVAPEMVLILYGAQILNQQPQLEGKNEREQGS